MLRYFSFFLLASLFSCAPVVPVVDHTSDLSSFFDCVRENQGVLLSAHRGGAVSGFAENTLPALKNTARAGLILLEIDVRASKDGVLYLLHDTIFDTKKGLQVNVETLSWKQLRTLTLYDHNQNLTSAHIPRFDGVLAWAKKSPVVLQLDIKGRASLLDVVSAVRLAGMSQRVMVITYTTKQAARMARLAPDIMVSVSIKDLHGYRALITSGVSARQILAWTGTKKSRPALMRALAEKTVESIYGTFGRVDALAKRNAGQSYRDLARNGVQIIATNRVSLARSSLRAEIRKAQSCSLPTI